MTDAKNYAGMGVSAVVDGVRYYAGNEKLMQKIGVPFTETQLVGTAVYCCTGHGVPGRHCVCGYY